MKMIFKYLGRYPVSGEPLINSILRFVKEPLNKSWMNRLSPARVANCWPIAALADTCNSSAHKHISIALENPESQSVSPRLNRRFPGHHGAVFIVLSLFTSAIFADVAVNRLEKNDKIVSDSLSVDNAIHGKVISEQNPVRQQSANNGSKRWELYAEQWELARSGESILLLPVLNQLINTWLLEKHKKIEVQYPGGEEGELWVQELADWLVSLGIPSNHIVIVPGSGADDMIKFGLIK